jgi:streptogramin lyase
MAGSVAGSGGSSAGGANCSGPAGRGGSTGATGGSGGTNPFVEFPTPTAASSPWDITTGPDGNLWFPELLGNNIGRITPSGVITEFPVPTAGASPFAITRASDGNLWFTEQDGNKIGRITTAGVVTEFPIPDANAKPSGIAAGADGRLWFTQRGISGFVGAVTTTGVFSKYPFPSYQVVSATASGITAGPDGALWFTYVVTTSVGGGSRVGRMSTSGEATEFSSPCPDSLTAVGPLSKIVPGPGGNLWFTMENTLASNYIGVSSTSGAITTFEILPSFGASGAPGASLRGIAAGPDGNVWFTEAGFGAVVRMTPSGTMTNIIGRDKTLNPAGITAGPDGNIWFTRSSSIARTAP